MKQTRQGSLYVNRNFNYGSFFVRLYLTPSPKRSFLWATLDCYNYSRDPFAVSIAKFHSLIEPIEVLRQLNHDIQVLL
jgi:hypothetical protein